MTTTTSHKNNDFFSQTFDNLGRQASKVWNAATGEANKINHRVQKNIDADGTEIAQGIQKNGFVGGAAAAFDVFSPGHLATEGLDDAGIVTDKNLKQLIAAGVNMGVGAAIPGAGLLLQLDALAEGYDGITGMMKGGKQGAVAGQQPAPGTACAPSQGNDAPSKHANDAARQQAIEAAKIKSARKAGYAQGFQDGVRAEAGDHHVHITDPGFGYAGGGYGCDYGSGDIGSLLDRSNEIWGSGNTDAATDKIDQMLNDPTLSFEDKIFMLMTMLMNKDQDELADESRKFADDQKAQQDKIDGLNKKIADLRTKNPQDPQLQNLIDERDNNLRQRDESRQETAQKLQRATEKLSEMQQALSAVLNSMHDTAMNTIRNIK